MLDDLKLSEIRAKHQGVKLHSLSYGDAEIVVRTPTRLEFRKWKADCQDERKRNDAAELLLLPCIVYPGPTESEALFDAQPGLIDTFGSELLSLVGFSQKAEKKAL